VGVVESLAGAAKDTAAAVAWTGSQFEKMVVPMMLPWPLRIVLTLMVLFSLSG